MYKSYAEFEQAFMVGKIAVQSDDGRIGLYKNASDILYWRPILQNIWNNNPWLHAE